MLLLSHPVAQANPGQNDNDRLETITVVESIPETGKVEHEEFTGSHQHIGQDQLERRDLTLAEIVSHEAGVQSRKSGGFGSFASITMRAATAAQTGVYLDGILLNGGGNAVVDLSLLDLLNAESVDIYRGITPAQLGSGAIGGAVNINSPGSNRKPLTKALLQFGSFNTEGAQLLHRARYAGWDLIGAFSLQQSENGYPFLDSNGTPLNTTDDTRATRNNAAARRLNGLAKARYEWSDESHTDILLQTTTRTLGIPEWRNLERNQASLESLNTRLHASHTINGMGNWNSRHTLFQHADTELFDDRLSQIGLAAQYLDSENNTLGFSTFWEHLGTNTTTSMQLELRHETLKTDNRLEQRSDYEASRDSLNATLQGSFYYGNDSLLVTPWLRLVASDDSYRRVTRQNSNQRDNHALSPGLGLRYNPHSKITYRANLGRFYREPSFDELFGSRGLFQGNNNLAAEEGINADMGFTSAVYVMS